MISAEDFVVASLATSMPPPHQKRHIFFIPSPCPSLSLTSHRIPSHPMQALCSVWTLPDRLRSYLLSPPAAPQPPQTQPALQQQQQQLALPSWSSASSRLPARMRATIESAYNGSQLDAIAACMGNDPARPFTLVQVGGWGGGLLEGGSSDLGGGGDPTQPIVEYGRHNVWIRIPSRIAGGGCRHGLPVTG